MPLADYVRIVDRAQQGLGRAVGREPGLLNRPGQSIACKIDQFYYLAVMPAFVERLARLAGVTPGRLQEALIRTGNLLTRGPRRDPVLPLRVGWGGRPLQIRAAFVDADFIDRAVRTFGDRAVPTFGDAAVRTFGDAAGGPGVSELKISRADKNAVDELFADKTPPQDLAYF